MKTFLASSATLISLCLVAGAASAEPARGAPQPTKPAALTAEDLEAKPVTLTLGQGEPRSTIIFMHGLGGNPKSYPDLLRAVLTPAPGAPAVKVVAIWMRPKEGLHTMTDQLARARRAIDAEQGPVVLMGHSFGGKAAVKLAAEYPEEKVAAVVALAPSVNMLQSYWKRITGERVLPEPEAMHAKLAQVKQALARNLAVAQARGDHELIEEAEDNLAYHATMTDLVGHDEAGTETHVNRPTLVLHGTEDEAVSIHYARRFAEANKGVVEFVELPGANHGFRMPANRKFDVATAMMKKPIQAFLAKRMPTAAARPDAPAAPAKLPEPAKKIGLLGRAFGR